MNRIDKILYFWFGEDGGVSLPSSEFTTLWFIPTEDSNQAIKELFKDDLKRAIAGKYKEWEQSPKGMLALILLYDQFSRRIYQGKVKAYTQDEKALKLCINGIKAEFDEHLPLLQRLFFYFPLMHSENFIYQQKSVNYIDAISQVALPETREIFNIFAKYALQHYEIIRLFNRFPDRNEILNRQSTPEEIELLKYTNFKS